MRRHALPVAMRGSELLQHDAVQRRVHRWEMELVGGDSAQTLVCPVLFPRKVLHLLLEEMESSA